MSYRDKNGREVGTVGFPLSEIEVKIAESREICYHGHNVMIGYYKDEKLARSVIDSEGCLHTGDLGYINEKGQLIFTG